MAVRLEEREQKEGKPGRLGRGFLDLDLLACASDGRASAQRSKRSLL